MAASQHGCELSYVQPCCQARDLPLRSAHNPSRLLYNPSYPFLLRFLCCSCGPSGASALPLLAFAMSLA